MSAALTQHLRSFAVAFLLWAVASVPASASTLTYDLGFTTDGALGEFAIRMLLDDDVDGNEAAIKAIVTLTPGRYVGDIVAVYLDLTSVIRPFPAPLGTIRDGVVGIDITGCAIHTSNVQAGNIGQTFSLGFAIGSPGIGSGSGDIRSTELLFTTPGLNLEHFAAVAVRVTSVGFEFGSRNLSRKMYDDAGTWLYNEPPAQTPEPGTWVLIGSGIGAVFVYRRRKASV